VPRKSRGYASSYGCSDSLWSIV